MYLPGQRSPRRTARKLKDNLEDRGKLFGNRLKAIVEAFINVSRHELLYGPLIGNENRGKPNPRQAFRLEVLDSFEPDAQAVAVLDGLIRYHIFLQDWRGKSQRGMLTPRLYLNRIFLPHAGLTLSSRDNIRVTNNELMMLLKKPGEFFGYWKRKRRHDESQAELEL